MNPIPVWRTDLCFILRTFESSIPSSPPSRLSTKHQVVSIILTQTTAPNSRSSLIHQLLGVTLVVAAVSLQHKSVTGVFVQAHQLGRSIPLLVCSLFQFSLVLHSAHLSGVRYLLCLQVTESVYRTAVPQLRIYSIA